MSNPSKAKGTGGESELVNLLNDYFPRGGWRRTSPGMAYDIVKPGDTHEPLEVLATRPDRGRWLMTMRLDQFEALLGAYEFERGTPVHIEVKRYRKFAMHAIYEAKFGGSK